MVESAVLCIVSAIMLAWLVYGVIVLIGGGRQ